MELLISAATAPQLVVGKISGIGLAGLTQVTLVLLPAVAALLLSGRLAASIFGTGDAAAPSLGGLSPGPPPRVPRVLRAGLRAVRGDVRGGGLAAQPARGPPDRGPAAVDPRDHGLLPGRPRAVRRRRPDHPVRVVRAAVEPVRDDGPALGRVRRAVGGRALGGAAGRSPCRSSPGSRSACTGRACCSTGSRRRCARSCGRSAARTPRDGGPWTAHAYSAASSSNGRRRNSASTGAIPVAPSMSSIAGSAAPGSPPGVASPSLLGPAVIERHSALWTPGR